jgi:NitT/TauT family transport system substrate-binding protein
MLRTGQADVALELEPNVSQAESEGAHIVYSLRDLYGDFAMTGLTATPDSLARQPELARDVVCSLQLADDYIRMHPESSLDILAKRFPEVNRDVAKQALSRMVANGIVPNGVTLQPSAWSKAINLRVESGDLSNPKSTGSYVDNQFADWAEQNCRLK